MKSTINVVCSADDNYIVPLQIMLKSLATNTNERINVFILASNISESNKQRIIYNTQNSTLDISFYSYKSLKSFDFKTSDTITYASYLRLFIADVLPQIDRCIYLDCDIIVEKDIKDLWNTSIKDKTIGAVNEMNPNAQFVSSVEGLPLYKKLKIPANRKYFNAGVLIINLKQWRKKQYSSIIIKYLQENKSRILWHDQDGLNAILWNDWHELNPHWNVMTALYRSESYRESIYDDADLFEELKAKPWIIHFTDVEKPWCTYCDNPMKYRYYEYLKKID